MSQVAPGGTVLDNFPQPETKQDEYFVEAVVNNSGTNFIELKALLNNRSMWPATVKNQMSFRYYFTREAGTTVTASLTSSEGAVITQPQLYTGDIYYVTVSFPNVKIFPGGTDDNNKLTYRKEAIFKLTSNGAWNPENDWSFDGVAGSGQAITKAVKITTYDNGFKLWGNEPDVTGCDPTVIHPYFQVNGSGSWSQSTAINLNQGDEVVIGPQPKFGGSWKWTGCNTNIALRELTLKPIANCDVVATYTNTCGTNSEITFNIKVGVVTGIGQDNLTETFMTAYPNPFNHEISMIFSSPAPEKLLIRVLDLKGSQVYQTDKFKTNEKFHLGNELSNGVLSRSCDRREWISESAENREAVILLNLDSPKKD